MTIRKMFTMICKYHNNRNMLLNLRNYDKKVFDQCLRYLPDVDRVNIQLKVMNCM